MRLKITLIASCIALTFVAADVNGADMTMVSQHRTVLGDSNSIGPPSGQQDIEERLAPDFLPYRDSVSTSAETAAGSASTDAFQLSTTGQCMLTAEGGFTSSAASAPPNVVAYSVGSSMYHVTFSLTQPSTCRIIGMLVSDDSAHSRVTLQRNGQSLLNMLAADESLAVAHQLDLVPGQYVITVSSIGTAAVQGSGKDVAAASYNLRLATCFVAADLNLDGAVNSDDLVGVILAWGPCSVPETCLADINRDGTVNADDLVAVVLAWG